MLLIYKTTLTICLQSLTCWEVT